MSDSRDLTAHYQLKQVLGWSGSARTFRGLDPETGRPVAVKLISLSRVPGADTLRQRFVQTAGVLSSLSHPSLPDVLDHGTTPAGDAFLVSDWIEGVPLDADGGAVDPGFLLPLMAQLVEALESLSLHGLVHLNLRPDNVLVEEGDRARLVGWGTSLLNVDWQSTAARAPENGLSEFSAPELRRGPSAADALWRADAYSLALLTSRLLGAVVEGEGGDDPRVRFPKALSEQLQRAEVLRESLEQCLDGRPERRPDAYSVILRAIQHAQPRDARPAPKETQPVDRNAPSLVAAKSELEGIGAGSEAPTQVVVRDLLAEVLDDDPEDDSSAQRSTAEASSADPAASSRAPSLERESALDSEPARQLLRDLYEAHGAAGASEGSEAATLVGPRPASVPGDESPAEVTPADDSATGSPVRETTASTVDARPPPLPEEPAPAPIADSRSLPEELAPDAPELGASGPNAVEGDPEESPESASAVSAHDETAALPVHDTVPQPALTASGEIATVVEPETERPAALPPPPPPPRAVSAPEVRTAAASHADAPAIGPPPAGAAPPATPSSSPSPGAAEGERDRLGAVTLWLRENRRIAALAAAGLAGIVVLALIVLLAFRLLGGAASPEAVVVASEPPPPSDEPTLALPEEAPVELPPELLAALDQIGEGRWLEARESLAGLAQLEEEGELDPALCVPFLATRELVRRARRDQILEQLDAGLRSARVASLRSTLARMDREEERLVRAVPGGDRRIERSRQWVDQAAGFESLLESGSAVAALERANRLAEEIPSLARTLDARNRAVASLDERIDLLMDADRLEEARSMLDDLERLWPSRPRTGRRLQQIAQRMESMDRYTTLLERIDALGRARPHEGLAMLEGVEAPADFAARFDQLRDTLQMRFEDMDRGAPTIQLAAPLEEIQYKKSEPITLELVAADDYEVISVTVSARLGGDATIRELAVEQLGDGRYQVVVPPSLHDGKPIEFWASVRDRSGHQGQLGSPQQPERLRRRPWYRRIG